MKTSLLLFAMLLPTMQMTHAAGWETVTVDGRDYVTARSINDFSRFETMKTGGDVLVLQNKVVEMGLTIGGREVFVNNVKFIFDSKILAHEGRHLVSRIDLAKIALAESAVLNDRLATTGHLPNPAP